MENEMKQLYIDSLCCDSVTQSLTESNNDINLSMTEDCIDVNLKSFCDIVDDVSSPLFKKYCSDYQNKKCVDICDAVYFDDECKYLKHCYYKKLNMFRNFPSDVNRKDMVEARSLYKCTVRKKKCIYDENGCLKLEKAKKANAKMYWKMLKGSVENSNCNHCLSCRVFLEYFKAVNDPGSQFYQPDDV